MIDMETLSRCCGKPMLEVVQLGRFVELECPNCGDRIFMKRCSESYAPHTSHTGWKEGVAYREA